jgi:hypothetical protein
MTFILRLPFVSANLAGIFSVYKSERFPNQPNVSPLRNVGNLTDYFPVLHHLVADAVRVGFVVAKVDDGAL